MLPFARMRAVLVALGVLMAGPLTAQSALAVPAGKLGKPREYQPENPTDEERPRKKTRIHAWEEAEPAQEPVTDFPWMPLGLTLLTFAVVAPFAWSAYRQTMEEMKPPVDSNQPRRRRPPRAE